MGASAIFETIEGRPQRPKKNNPPSSTKDDEEPQRAWRKLQRDRPRVGKKKTNMEAFAKFGRGIVAGNGHKLHKNTKRAER